LAAFEVLPPRRRASSSSSSAAAAAAAAAPRTNRSGRAVRQRDMWAASVDVHQTASAAAGCGVYRVNQRPLRPASPSKGQKATPWVGNTRLVKGEAVRTPFAWRRLDRGGGSFQASATSFPHPLHSNPPVQPGRLRSARRPFSRLCSESLRPCGPARRPFSRLRSESLRPCGPARSSQLQPSDGRPGDAFAPLGVPSSATPAVDADASARVRRGRRGAAGGREAEAKPSRYLFFSRPSTSLPGLLFFVDPHARRPRRLLRSPRRLLRFAWRFSCSFDLIGPHELFGGGSGSSSSGRRFGTRIPPAGPNRVRHRGAILPGGRG